MKLECAIKQADRKCSMQKAIRKESRASPKTRVVKFYFFMSFECMIPTGEIRKTGAKNKHGSTGMRASGWKKLKVMVMAMIRLYLVSLVLYFCPNLTHYQVALGTLG